jgi:cytoskeletal protein RodZ
MQREDRVRRVVLSVVLSLVGLFILGGIVSATQGTSTPTTQPTSAVKPKVSAPVITHKTDVETSSILFSSTTQDDSSMPSGTTAITTHGVNGVETKTYDETLTNGLVTSKILTSDATTVVPVTQVTSIGTYVAPAAPSTTIETGCTNGSYVNSAGNTVCSPEKSSSVPAGATAQCVDGSYSFSQSRRGTCSYHGGVADWL